MDRLKMRENQIIELKRKIFGIENEEAFKKVALEVFYHQAKHNSVYSDFIGKLGRNPEKIDKIEQIPYLPISFFKSHKVVTNATQSPELFFESSGTGNTSRSRHYIADPSIYRESLLKGFKILYGQPSDYVFLALLPTYLDNPHSSLIYMVDCLMKESGQSLNGYFTNDYKNLKERIAECKRENKKYILWGVTYALLKFSEQDEPDLGENAIIIETGGMKGHGKEMIREELHLLLKKRFSVKEIHSEYGMSELLSQAWCTNGILFNPPPWMKVLIRDIYDPFQFKSDGHSGAINVIDLANIHSCSFIATDDIGRIQGNGFEVLGRMDNSDIRGCNLLVQD